MSSQAHLKLFIDDELNPNTKIALYADHTKIRCSIKSDFGTSELKKDINYLHNWD